MKPDRLSPSPGARPKTCVALAALFATCLLLLKPGEAQAQAAAVDEAPPKDAASEVSDAKIASQVEAFCESLQNTWFSIFDEDAKAGWSHAKLEVIEVDGQRVLRYTDEEEIVGQYWGEVQTHRYEYLVDCQVEPPYHLLRQVQRQTERGFVKEIEIVPDPDGGPGDYLANITEGDTRRTTAVDFPERFGEPRALTFVDLYRPELMAMAGEDPGEPVTYLSIDSQELAVESYRIEFKGLVSPGDEGAPESLDREAVKISLGNEEIGDFLDGYIDRRGHWMNYAYRLSLRYEVAEGQAQAQDGLGEYVIDGSEEILASQAMGDPSRVSQMTVRLPGDWREVMPDTDLQRVTYDADKDRTTVRVRVAGFEPQPLSGDERKEYLRATGELPTDDPKLRELAKSIVEGATSDAEKVDRIAAYVTRALNYQIDLDPLSVQEALKANRGDCSEHATLFATLARAVGLPARTISGWVYAGDDPPEFGFHAWNEVAIDGYWRSLDTTWGEALPNATHLRCELNDGDRAFWEIVEDGLVVDVVSFKSNPAAALAAVEQRIEAYPEEGAWYASRGSIVGGPEGLRDLERATELSPDVAEFFEQLSYEYWNFDRLKPAIAAMQRAAELAPENTAYWLTLSDLLYAVDDYEASLAAVDRLIELQPGHARYHVERALVCLAMEDHEGVDAAASKALELWPDLAGAHEVLGHSLVARDRHEEAAGRFFAALEIEPLDRDSWDGWIDACSASGTAPPAKEVRALVSGTLKAIGRDPGVGRGLLLDVAAIGRGGISEKLATGLIERARKRDDVAGVREWSLIRGEVLAAHGKAGKALAAIDEVIAQDAWSADAHLARGRVLMLLAEDGDEDGLDEAASAIEKAIDLDPENGRAPVSLALVRRMQGRFGDQVAVLYEALDTLADLPESLYAFADECEQAGFPSFSSKAQNLIE